MKCFLFPLQFYADESSDDDDGDDPKNEDAKSDAKPSKFLEPTQAYPVCESDSESEIDAPSKPFSVLDKTQVFEEKESNRHQHTDN